MTTFCVIDNVIDKDQFYHNLSLGKQCFCSDLKKAWSDKQSNKNSNIDFYFSIFC